MPEVVLVYPLCGPTTGQTQLTVLGKNFAYIGQEKAYCIFDNTFYEPATVINSTLMYCDTPAVLDKFGNNVNNTEHYNISVTMNLADIIPSEYIFNYYTMPSIHSLAPYQGPISGGTEVKVFGNDFSKHCNLTVRFGTTTVWGKLVESGVVKGTSPEVSCPGEVIVQVSLNAQQYTLNQLKSDLTTFTYYRNPVVSYAEPRAFPMTGGSPFAIHGKDFMFSRNFTKNDDGSERIYYNVRFIDDKGKELGRTRSDQVFDNQLLLKSIPVDQPYQNVRLEVSPNDQQWHPCETPVSFYRAPSIKSIDPKFGPIKQHHKTLTVDGKNFDCAETDCPHLKCSYSTDDFVILTDGMRIDSQTIYCDIPSVSRPDITQFRITLNGFDYTSENITYTFYDAFILNLVPQIIPMEGGTNVQVNGYGFADTGSQKVKFEKDQTDLNCKDGKPCRIPAKYNSPSQLTFIAPPEAEVKTQGGANIRYDPFDVEVSIHGDTFTDNNLKLQYYDQPEVGSLTDDNSPYEYHANSVETLHVPVDIHIPDNTDPEEFLRKTIVTCKYEIDGETVVVPGTLAVYPLPTKPSEVETIPNTINCPTTEGDPNGGDGQLSIAINGQDYVGHIPLKVLPQLKLASLQPQCGPKEGGTHVTINPNGFKDTDIDKLFFTWSTVCTDPISKDMFTDDKKIKTIAPPVPFKGKSPGG